MAKSNIGLVPRNAAAASNAAANASSPFPTKAQTGAKQKDLTLEIAALSNMSYPDLQARWSRHFRYRAPKKLRRDQLELGIAWKLQAQTHGGLDAATRRRLDALVHTFEIRSDLAPKRATTLKPGARLLRAWGGKTHEILVTEAGFLWGGKTWASLSIIAREITGTRWSGPRFFGLGTLAKPAELDHA